MASFISSSAMILRSCAQISVSLESELPCTLCAVTCHLDSFLHPYPLESVDPFMYRVPLNPLKNTKNISFYTCLRSLSLNSKEQKLYLVLTWYSPLFRGLAFSTVLSTTLCRDRQIIHAMNTYAFIGLIAWLLIMLQISSCFLINSSKTKQIY